RNLPKLIFVTSREALAQNIGQVESDRVLRAVAESGAVLLDNLPQGLPNGLAGVARVRPELKKYADELKGVVLLGGYDVVPPIRLDVLDPRLRQSLGPDHG